ncbi:MAG: hypothetical protein ACRDQ7_09475 [Haloechinothrix sp.]
MQTLLDKGRAVGAKALRAYNEVKAYADAARWCTARRWSPTRGMTASYSASTKCAAFTTWP